MMVDTEILRQRWWVQGLKYSFSNAMISHKHWESRVREGSWLSRPNQQKFKATKALVCWFQTRGGDDTKFSRLNEQEFKGGDDTKRR